MTELAASGATIDEAFAFGQPVDFDKKPKECGHRSLAVDYAGALIQDEQGGIADREVRVRVRCMECGVPCGVSLDVRRPKGGEEHGVILVVEPMEDE